MIVNNNFLETAKMNKTNVIRILEKLKIEHFTIEYETNEDELDAVTVANKINSESEKVFKTLVARGDKTGINVFVIPGNYELDLKKAASISDNKKIEMIKVKEINSITGYIRGGCSPIGMKKNYPTFIDESALLFETIFVSAGVRGMQLNISAQDLVEVTEAKIGDLI